MQSVPFHFCVRFFKVLILLFINSFRKIYRFARKSGEGRNCFDDGTTIFAKKNLLDAFFGWMYCGVGEHSEFFI